MNNFYFENILGSSSSADNSSSSSSSSSSSDSTVRVIRIAIEVGHSQESPGGAYFHPDFRHLFLAEYNFWNSYADDVISPIREEFERSKHRLPVKTELEIRKFNRGGTSLTHMVNQAVDWNPHIAVALHLNGLTDNVSARGYLNRYATGNNEAASLSQFIRTRYAQMQPYGTNSIPGRSDVTGPTGDHAWLRIEGATLFVEPAFITNREDASYVVNCPSRICNAVSEGVYDYMVSKGYAVRTRA